MGKNGRGQAHHTEADEVQDESEDVDVDNEDGAVEEEEQERGVAGPPERSEPVKGRDSRKAAVEVSLSV